MCFKTKKVLEDTKLINKEVQAVLGSDSASSARPERTSNVDFRMS